MKPLMQSETTQPVMLGGPIRLSVAPALAAPALRFLSDERLARLAAAGDRAALGVVFDRYHEELFRYCVSLLRDREDAADALQSTMLRALRALEGETRDIALRPWLYRIAHNESMNLLRRRPPQGDSHAELPATADWSVEAGADARARIDQLLRDLRELPERQRGALVMREMAGLEYPEIAAALNTSPAGAKQAIYDARRALYELAKGREMDCDGIRLKLSDGDRRAIRARAVRAHLRACSECRDLERVTAERRSTLASLAPAGLAANAVRTALVGSGAGGLGGASLVAGLATPAAIKGLAAIVIAALAGAGAVESLPSRSAGARPAAAVSRAQAPHGAAARSIGGAAGPSSASPAAQQAQGRARANAGPSSPSRTRSLPGRHDVNATSGAAQPADSGQPAKTTGRGQASVPAPAAQSAPQTHRGWSRGTHRGGTRSGGSGGSGGGRGLVGPTTSTGGPVTVVTNTVVPQAQADVQQVQGTVTSTVDQVTGQLPVHLP
ncbi:MAG: hypothetical protein QOF37_1707 [Thermoleophilaceae bacterium]|nr:hypothetical protein [Thermoleophilaceae bacterium]